MVQDRSNYLRIIIFIFCFVYVYREEVNIPNDNFMDCNLL